MPDTHRNPDTVSPNVVWCYDPPGNMSKEHFWLQHLARIYLHDNHYCNCVAREVSFPLLLATTEAPPDTKEAVKYRLGLERLDVVAIGPRSHILGSQPMSSKQALEKVSIGVEVKISRSDFLSGFHSRCCNFNYVLAPAGMIKKIELPEGCGLLCADRDGSAIRIVRRASELKDCAFSIETVIFAIAVALTTEYANHARTIWPEEVQMKYPSKRRLREKAKEAASELRMYYLLNPDRPRGGRP